jgi:hypothetical protein
MNESGQLELLDILTIISFCIQMQNQNKIFSIHDIQSDNDRVLDNIHQHLKIQDDKIDQILSLLKKGDLTSGKI